MAEKPAPGGHKKQTSIIRRFNLALVLIYFASLGLTAPAVYFATRHQVYAQANEDLRLLVDVVQSIQGYVATDLRPHFLKQGIFYSPAISGIVATSRIAGHLQKRQPQYYVKSASDNPLNPTNGANALEASLLERFRQGLVSGEVTEEGLIQGRPYLVAAAPKMSKKGCLRCHGDPGKAPPDVTQGYGTESGYNYRLGAVVGLSVVGVPLADVNGLALERSLTVMAAVTILFALLFAIVNTMVRRLILSPLVDITKTAKAVSEGHVNRRVSTATGRRDEIADLARSFEMLRRSLVTAMKRLQQKG